MKIHYSPYYHFQVCLVVFNTQTDANPIIPRNFLSNLVKRLTLPRFTSRHNGSPPNSLQGGLAPDFAPPPRFPRQSAYGAPTPAVAPAPSYGSAPSSNSFTPSLATYGSAPSSNNYNSPSSSPSVDTYGSPAAAPVSSGGDSYGSPAAPAVGSGDSYGSPAAPAIGNQDSYGSPSAPVVGAGDSYSSPSAPALASYGSSSNNCEVIRSLTRVGDDCQQGGQECESQCTTTQEQECTTEYKQQCSTVNEQVRYPKNTKILIQFYQFSK